MSKYTLTIDCAMCACSAGVYSDQGKMLAVMSEPMNRGQAEALVPMIDRVVHESGKEFQDLTDIVCTIGPGGFTGVRIGVAAAKAYALSLGIPAYGVTGFQALAAQFYIKDKENIGQNLLVLIETKREEYFTQFYAGGMDKTRDAELLNKDDISDFYDEDVFIVGDAYGRLLGESDKSYKGQQVLHPDMMTLGVLGQLHQETLSAVVPFYLREADVSKPKNRPRKISS